MNDINILKSLLKEEKLWAKCSKNGNYINANVLLNAVNALEQRKQILILLDKEKIEVNKVLIKLENRTQTRLDWDSWWDELKNNYPNYIRKYESKRLINLMEKILRGRDDDK